MCGSDLWRYRGIQDVIEPTPIGPEYVGVVEAVGAAVTTIKPGQFVVGGFLTSDNTCPLCKVGAHANCLRGTGYDGCQAELIRIQNADGTLLSTPEHPGEALIPHVLALSDVMCTGWHAAVCADVRPGRTVVVVGDGAVGLSGVLAAAQLGAERIIAMSRHADRQAIARDFGATDIVAERGDEGVERVMDLTDGIGADAVLECVGTEDSVTQALRSARPGGMVGWVGVPHVTDLPQRHMFWKNVGLRGGPAPVRAYLPDLLKRVLDGRIQSGKVFASAFPWTRSPRGMPPWTSDGRSRRCYIPDGPFPGFAGGIRDTHAQLTGCVGAGGYGIGMSIPEVAVGATSVVVPGNPDPVRRRLALSPSRAGDFRQCPLLYRFRAIDRLPEPSSPAAVRGTLVHLVLEQMFGKAPALRTPEITAGDVDPVWERMLGDHPELGELLADSDVLGWLDSARNLVRSYFELEDPRRFSPEATELLVEIEVGAGVPLRGFVDRVDVAPTGQIRVVDYKTGSAPREAFEAKAMYQLKFYALMLWKLRGVLPAQLKLLYLADGQPLVYAPEESEMRAFERAVSALWAAISRAVVSGNFQPNRSKLCGWCAHQSLCPEFGGTPPPYPGPPVGFGMPTGTGAAAPIVNEVTDARVAS